MLCCVVLPVLAYGRFSKSCHGAYSMCCFIEWYVRMFFLSFVRSFMANAPFLGMCEWNGMEWYGMEW